MEHPLITDADSLTLEELQTKVNDLTKKLSWAYRSGNAHLQSQIQMALETYQNKMRERQTEMWNKGNSGSDFSNKIDIS